MPACVSRGVRRVAVDLRGLEVARWQGLLLGRMLLRAAGYQTGVLQDRRRERLTLYPCEETAQWQ